MSVIKTESLKMSEIDRDPHAHRHAVWLFHCLADIKDVRSPLTVNKENSFKPVELAVNAAILIQFSSVHQAILFG